MDGDKRTAMKLSIRKQDGQWTVTAPPFGFTSERVIGRRGSYSDAVALACAYITRHASAQPLLPASLGAEAWNPRTVWSRRI